MVTPHISDYQWRGIRFEAVREFIRNRRPDVRSRSTARTCRSGRDDELPGDVSLFLISLPIQWMAQRKSSAMMKSTAAKINSRRIAYPSVQRLARPRQTKRRRPSQFQV